MRHISMALLALVGLIAFAPAPFPRKERELPNRVSLEAMRGTWRVLDFESVTAQKGRSKIGQWFHQVRVSEDQWHYVTKNGGHHSPYRITIDPSKRPAAIDFYSAGATTPGMIGLVKREGNHVTVLYYATQPQNRPLSFEASPTGWWVLTLERQN